MSGESGVGGGDQRPNRSVRRDRRGSPRPWPAARRRTGRARRGRSRRRPRPRPHSCGHCRRRGPRPRPAGSSCRAAASSNTSAASASCAANTVLLRTLASWPEPRGPRWRTGSPNVSSTGRQRSTTSAGPPAITSSSPLAALCPPPLTGASITWRAGKSSWSRRQVVGCTVLWTMTIEPVGHRAERAVGSPQHLVHAGVVDHAHAEDVAGRAELREGGGQRRRRCRRRARGTRGGGPRAWSGTRRR